MDNKVIGADFDNTWTTHPEIHGEVDCIITGNSWEEAAGVMEELDRKDIPVFFNTIKSGEENLSNIVSHKSSVINEVGVTRFYEDQPQQVKLLQIMCPKCKIILVENYRNYI